MTGCGCLLLVGVLAVILYVLLFGSTDAGPPIETAVALVVLAQAAMAGRRGAAAVARS